MNTTLVLVPPHEFGAPVLLFVRNNGLQPPVVAWQLITKHYKKNQLKPDSNKILLFYYLGDVKATAVVLLTVKGSTASYIRFTTTCYCEYKLFSYHHKIGAPFIIIEDGCVTTS